MKKINKTKKKNIVIYHSDNEYIALVDMILEDRLEVIRVLKDDHRSRVVLIEYRGKKLVIKEPIEKNKRKWQRFLNFFRGSESLREYKSCNLIINSGFNGAKALLAIDVYKGRFVEESYFVSEFIEGTEGNRENLTQISKELDFIHSKGYLHGDSQLPNFMIGKEGKIYLIDCKLIKNIYGKFGSRYEFIYLEESCHRTIDIYPKNDIYYRGAKALNLYRHWLGRTKKKIRGKK